VLFVVVAVGLVDCALVVVAAVWLDPPQPATETTTNAKGR
jgi:hypothetical protein